jgi:hypothetical protein
MEKEESMDWARATTSGPSTDSTARPSTPRVIETRYFAYGSACRDADILRRVRSKHADIAARNAMWRMSQNAYGAGVAEVWNTETGKHVATITCYGPFASMQVEFLDSVLREGALGKPKTTYKGAVR